MKKTLGEEQKQALKSLPGVDHILEISSGGFARKNIPHAVAVRSVRRAIQGFRADIIRGDGLWDKGGISDDRILERAEAEAEADMAFKLVPVINATGVIIHTNLGRSLLAEEALERISGISSRYSNLEFDLEAGARGSRHAIVEELLCEISGAESAMAVNNNAAAVLICLDTLARGRRVAVSRGELVEIGGSFRIPDVMKKSGCRLKEVGTTNRTHLRDYGEALDDEDVALLLKVHTSNYSVVGFASDVPLKDLVALGAARSAPVMEDLGSGTFIDFSRFGLEKEPTVQESVASGADVVTFSGDKLLGGPQAGVIVGRKRVVDQIKQNPLARAMRVDKLTLAALEATLRIYRDPPEKAVRRIPVLDMLTLPMGTIEKRAGDLAARLRQIDDPRLEITELDGFSKAGGGSLPLLRLSTKCVAMRVSGVSANRAEKMMRAFSPPVIGRIERDRLILDARTIRDDEPPVIARAALDMLRRL
ncbi:L-seryl-tRNA(Sec) selenium transferase [Candidatus Desulfarcum epimagneticum]|uniref:L-seryl-tRNA(Sec) selenium transferase n=1 Tax=uncultured Desulfobacteraceae bacterium TaxID=218296 RepID=A0A484HHN2_9BACT|nr:L-seryl-tRNA(Sec) selenium transferase [uncultured Desulfobacteraceae bacterium]